jgi:hypothetical protein
MRAILHIGTEKTGTTSLQAFMHHNRLDLLEQGVLYPENLGGINHRFVASYCLSLETSDESIRSMGLTSQSDMQEFYERVEAQLKAQVERNPNAAVCILSTEHLHSRLKSAEQITRVRTLLESIFDEIEVHVHLRPQVDVAVSLASTQSRVGGRVGRAFFDSMSASQIYYNYDMLVSTWETVFGAERIFCLPFNAKPDFLGYIASRTGLDLTRLPRPARTNEALDVRVMAMVNAIVDSQSAQRIDFRVLDLLPVEEKLTLDEPNARRIQHRFEESNRVLIARRDDLQPGQLQPKWSRFSEHGNLELLEQPCPFGSSLADLVKHYNKVIQGLDLPV